MSRRILNPTFLFASLDFALAAASFWIASAWLFELDLDAAGRYIGPLAPRAISFAVLVMIGLMAMGLYRARQRPRTWETVARVIAGVAIGTVCFIMLFFMLPYLASGRGVLLGSMLAACILIGAGRLVLLHFVDRNPVKTRVLVIGTGPSALKIGRLRRASDRRRFEVIGYAAATERDHASAEQYPELRPVIPIENVMGFPGVDEIVVALDERRGTLPVDLLLKLKGRGIPVVDIIDFLERETGRVDLDLLSPSWFLYTQAGYTDSLFRGTKRVVDILLSTLVLALTSPIFLTVILLIWIDDGFRAPILYRQKRVGRGDIDFELLKFRSMRRDAEDASGPQWAAGANDERVTRVGRVIRRFRIDELPQLFNVLSGEMSIVGPRPERPEFVKMLASEIPMFGVRHNMRPGLTGWAQLNFPYGASITDAKEKLSYDIAYIKNASVLLDLRIFLETIEVVIWGKAISMAGPPRAQKDRRGHLADDEKDQGEAPEYSRVTPVPIQRATAKPEPENFDGPDSVAGQG